MKATTRCPASKFNIPRNAAQKDGTPTWSNSKRSAIMGFSSRKTEFFNSAKTVRPIGVDSDLFRDALIRATLDPAVRSIDAFPGAMGLAIVARDDGRFAFGVNSEAPSSDVSTFRECTPLPPLILTAKEVRSEPRYSNDRLVWSARRRRVSIGLRLQIQQVLVKGGPIKLRDLMTTIQVSRDMTTAVFALACSDLVELDLASAPLCSESFVKCRS
jgi:hypothetical protein